MALSITIDGDTTTNSKKLPQYLVVFFVTMGALTIGTYVTWGCMPLYSQCNVITCEKRAPWISLVVPFGAVFGTIPASPVADTVGRKKAILFAGLQLFACWFLIRSTHNILWIALARFLGGFACGAASVVIPMYVSEIAEDSIRGSLGVIFHLQIIIGILFTYTTGFITSDREVMSLLCVFPPALLLIGLPLVPESPVWLVMEGRFADADQAIKRLRGKHYRTEEEIATLKHSCDTRGVITGILNLKDYSKAIFISLGLMAVRQLSGIYALKFYSDTIFEQAGFILNSTFYTMVVLAVQVVAVCFSTILIERAGRKTLLFINACIMTICMFVLAGYFYFLQKGNDLSIVNWLPLLSFTIYIISFSVGFGPIAWLMVGELFTHNMKSIASSATAFCYWILTFLLTKYLKVIVDLVGLSVFFAVFGAIGLMSTAFIAYMVPETKGKTIEQVQVLLYGRNDKTSNNILPLS